ncbi:hypothetical protein CLF_104532 [Clonorchis sinensis]|uniref:Uncharacterized protein n=1 Tax=Clonorchis sinensis TaxID=79923 RepID=G7YBU6_CLOSI|nr:hypothetical protein CLF_104532 [Clonorchis sinensis]
MSGSDNIKNAIRHHVFALSTLFGYAAFATQYFISCRLDPTTDNRMLGFANKLEQSIDTLNAGQVSFPDDDSNIVRSTCDPLWRHCAIETLRPMFWRKSLRS